MITISVEDDDVTLLHEAKILLRNIDDMNVYKGEGVSALTLWGRVSKIINATKEFHDPKDCKAEKRDDCKLCIALGYIRND